jgi:hypothetical protein
MSAPITGMKRMSTVHPALAPAAVVSSAKVVNETPDDEEEKHDNDRGEHEEQERTQQGKVIGQHGHCSW